MYKQTLLAYFINEVVWATLPWLLSTNTSTQRHDMQLISNVVNLLKFTIRFLQLWNTSKSNANVNLQKNQEHVIGYDQNMAFTVLRLLCMLCVIVK